jgi:hypothetical protein
MIEHDCGVIVEESFVLKRVDENFIEERRSPLLANYWRRGQ